MIVKRMAHDRAVAYISPAEARTLGINPSDNGRLPREAEYIMQALEKNGTWELVPLPP